MNKGVFDGLKRLFLPEYLGGGDSTLDGYSLVADSTAPGGARLAAPTVITAGVTLACAELGGSNTGSAGTQTVVPSSGAAAAPVTGLACSVTPPTGVDLEITGDLPFVQKDATANYVQLQIWEDGVSLQSMANWIVASTEAGLHIFLRRTPTANVLHTYTLTANTPTAGGNATINYSTVIVNSLVVKAA